MDGQMDGQLDGLMDGQTDGQTSKQTDGHTDGWEYIRIGRQMWSKGFKLGQVVLSGAKCGRSRQGSAGLPSRSHSQESVWSQEI